MKMLEIDDSKYTLADPKDWLVFTTSSHERIHPVLAGRLAFLCSAKGRKLNISRGFVSYEEQKAIGEALLRRNPTWYKSETGAVYKPAIKDSKGNVIKPAVCMVAAPGNSNHEFGHAVDSGDAWFKVLSNTELIGYGLFKPILPDEPWHAQLLESKGVSKGVLKQNYENLASMSGNIEEPYVDQNQADAKEYSLNSELEDSNPASDTKTESKRLLPFVQRFLAQIIKRKKP